MCECKDMSMDLRTPRNVYLSAFYKRSFAYHTVKNRMPVIITQLLDTLHRNKEDIIKQFGEGASEDLKQVISELSKFKYEVQTNKLLTKLITDEPDIKIYNNYIDKQATEENETTYFNTIWLLTECYMYRRIKQIFTLTRTLKDFDYFRTFKLEQFEKSMPLMLELGKYCFNTLDQWNKFDEKKEVLKMMKINLWGNKCDLSISLGKVEGPGNLFDTEALEPFVLVDDFERIYQVMKAPILINDQTVDIVLDNAGYELFTDLCLMDFFMTYYLARRVRFHVKAIPWFISDVTAYDFQWTVDQMRQGDDFNLKELGRKWQTYIFEEVWTVHAHTFWTSPYEFKYMEEFAPDLYKTLTTSKMVIFKGDLNYRKLFGEKNWDPVTNPEEALEGFQPTRILALRTIKSDIVVGLKPGVAEECEQKDPKWMEKGDYGVVQFIYKLMKGW